MAMLPLYPKYALSERWNNSYQGGKYRILSIFVMFLLTVSMMIGGGGFAYSQQPTNTPAASHVNVYYDREAFNQITQWMPANLLNFDELQQGTNLPSDQYAQSYGITFKGNPENPIITSKVNGAYAASSQPNLLMISSPVPEQSAVFEGRFNLPAVYFGFTLIGMSDMVTVTVSVLDGQGNPIQDISIPYPPSVGNEPASQVFVGIMSDSYSATIGGFRLTQVKTMGIQLALGLDDFFTGNQPVSLMLSMSPESFDFYRGGRSSRIIHFDELQQGSRLQNDQYAASHGIVFSCSPENFIVTNLVNGYAKPSTLPNMLMISSPVLEQPAVFEGTFQQPVPFFAFKLIAFNDQVTVTLTVYDRNKKVLQEYPLTPMYPSAGGNTDQTFVGVAAISGVSAIGGFKLTHTKTAGVQLAMGLDDLIVPGTDEPVATPVQNVSPTPELQPTATFTPTVTSTPTATPAGSMIYLMNSSSPEMFNIYAGNASQQVLNFDELQQGTTIRSETYTNSYGVRFTGTPENPIITGKVNGSAQAASLPNLLMISSPNLDQSATLDVKFVKPVPFFAFTAMGLSDQVAVLMDVYDAQGNPIQAFPVYYMPPSPSSGMAAGQTFVGISATDLLPVIGGFRITHTKIMGAQLAMGFDNLIISGSGVVLPTQTLPPTPTSTILPPTPTQTAAPTVASTPTRTAAPTATVALPTPTRTAVPTAIPVLPTATRTAAPTATVALPTPTRTSAPTATVVLPTPTRTAAPTATVALPTPTRTAAPTATVALPTPTRTAAPTATVALPTPTPTAIPSSTEIPPSPTPIYVPTNTPEPEPTMIEVYEFDQSSLGGNGLSEISGGFQSSTPGNYQFMDFSENIFPSSEDKRGLGVTVKPGQVTFLYAHNPVVTDGNPVLLRLTVRADNPWAAVALVALRGDLSKNLDVDGSLAMNNPATAQSFIDGERRLILVYEPDQGQEFTAAFQIANLSKASNQVVQVWIDKLEILKLSAKHFGAKPLGGLVKPTMTPTKSFIQPSPTYSKSTPTSTPTKFMLVTPTPTKKAVPPKLGWVEFVDKAPNGSGPNAYMKEDTTSSLMINFNIPGMFASEEQIDGEVYHKVSIPGQGNLSAEGKPELPIIGKMVEIPYGVTPRIEIYKQKSITLPNYNIIPVQKKDIRAFEVDDPLYPKDEPFVMQKDAILYALDAPYPKVLADFAAEDLGVIRGHRVLFFQVHPIQYNPATRELTGYSNIEVKITYDKPGQVKRVPARLASEPFELLLQDSVLNFKPEIRFPTEEITVEPNGCDYLIIANNKFFDAKDINHPLNRLKAWKQRKGLRTKVVDLQQIQSGNIKTVTEYIQNAYDTWTPAPSYVLLVGDAEYIPANYKTSHPTSHNNTLVGSDLYFGTVDGNDYFPDIYVGRLSVDTAEQLETVVNKILDYEMNPPNQDAFYNNTPLVCLYEDTRPKDAANRPKGNGTEDGGFRIIDFAEEIRDFLLSQGYNTQRIYDNSGPFPQGPLRLEDGTDLPSYLTLHGDPANHIAGFPWDGDTADITGAINAGRFMVIYNGHGGRSSWAQPNLQNADVQNLNNGKMTPVVFSWACMTGWFDTETDAPDLSPDPGLQPTNFNDVCLCETFQRKKDGGAVAIIGSSRVSWSNNDFMKPGAVKAIWPAFDPNPPLDADVPEISNSPLFRMGQINTFSKLYMAQCCSADVYRKVSFEMYTLFGDPEMPMWTKKPAELKLTYPASIGSIGKQTFVVHVKEANREVPVANAMAVLTQDQRLVAIAQTDPEGYARFEINNPIAGSLLLTVTKLNNRPVEGTITVTANGATLNRIQPRNGVPGQDIFIGGTSFANEQVDIFFDGVLVKTTQAINGSFGQAGVQNVTFRVPSPFPVKPVNIVAKGKISNRYAVTTFLVRTENPIDLYTYSQWDESTWHLHNGNNAIWNNPEIQLYNEAGDPVGSNNLEVGKNYKVKVKVHNDTDFNAQAVTVTFKWADFGIGQPERAWETIEPAAVIDVPSHSVQTAEAIWSPPRTGHLCIKASIFHREDVNTNNNEGQENCHIGPTSSPAKVTLTVWNPTDKAAAYYFELRQINGLGSDARKTIWETKIEHPDPQTIPAGEKRDITVWMDPELAGIKSGEKAEFALTGYMNGVMQGGVNFIINKK